jgi:hypothetical protein
MLADDLIAAVGGDGDRLYRGAFSLMAPRLKAAQRFDLAPEVLRSALTIARSAIGPQLRALSLCKLPFQRCWFEWPGAFSGLPSLRGNVGGIPRRMGALVTTDESLQRGTIVYAWLHPDSDLGGANICPLLVTFDWRPEATEPVPDLGGAARWHEQASAADWQTLAGQFDRVRLSSRADVIAETRRFGIMGNPMMEKFMDYAEETSPDAVGKILAAANLDIEGEPPLLRAAIMLLNSRNLARTEPRPIPAKLQRARGRNGKPPLLDYTHVGIRLTRALGARAGMASDPHHPNRLHLVRGHFKIRRSGVFWWAPHSRGTPDLGPPIKGQTRHVVL